MRLAHNNTLRLMVFALLFFTSGCDFLKPPLHRVPLPDNERPWMNLPRSLREWNWGGGSCVHASTVHLLRWCGRPDLADLWRKRYAGGETSYGLRSKLDANGISYSYTERGNLELLEYASRTRRGAVIFYFPNHSINFCGFEERDGQQFAVLLDNNRIDNYLWVPKDRFVNEWRGYGGFALTVTMSPTQRLPYGAFQEEI